ncbi:transmembrane protease serine 9 [Notolabrus celidotus]|uniref:transmembrane protease serine 9 n=1 Tax=Notolabrus celidotus TaxID=1203425 RepID=UPI00148FA16B|nr:transmembrane protease serine 9 [Notolabrus celidotus]
MTSHGVICAATLLTLLAQGCLSQRNVCGKPPLNTRIVGGETAPVGNWPWQASVQRGGGHICGGSLINSEWVVSAAHCFSSTSNIGVSLGLQSLEGSNPNAVTRTVSQIIIHPDYNTTTLENDISLLKLSSPVNFNDFILPVCLAESGSSFFDGTNSWVTGWGNIRVNVPLPPPKNLMEVEVPIVGNKRCNCKVGGTITENMICAGLVAGGKDSCQGDSGGPLVSKQGSRWVLAGIVSFGNGCAMANSPGVYTRVSSYQLWINSHITSNRPGYIRFSSTGTDSDLSVTCEGLPTLPPTVPPTTMQPTTMPPTTTAKPVVCGQATMNSRVVGGSSVSSAGLWPWMASLQRNGGHVCGGTLVSVDSVLSNANCFSSSPVPSEWTVVLGRLKQKGSNPFEMTLNVKNITVSNLTGSNVAVLQLETNPTLSTYIQPICLDNGQTFSEGSTCYGAGWSAGRGGEEEVLQEFQTSVVSCGNASTSDRICTGSFTLEQGDSGGPLMCKVGGSWFQAAVLSFENNSRGRARADQMMVLEKLSTFKNFLENTVGAFLSPASSSNSSSNSSSVNTTASTSMTTASSSVDIPHSFIMFSHLLLFALCLQLFI